MVSVNMVRWCCLVSCVLAICLTACLSGCKPKQVGPPLSPEARQEFESLIAKSTPPADTSFQRATLAGSQLKAAGITTQAVYIGDAAGGKKTLVVVIDYSKSLLSSSPGAFITAAVDALIKVAGVKSLDLSGLSYITVALRDSKDRIIMEAGAPAGDADAFRKGQVTQSQFGRKIIIQVMDRFAAFEAMGTSSK